MTVSHQHALTTNPVNTVLDATEARVLNVTPPTPYETDAFAWPSLWQHKQYDGDRQRPNPVHKMAAFIFPLSRSNSAN